MSNFKPGDSIRVKTNYPSIKFRGDTGVIQEEGNRKYLVQLEENGSTLIDEHYIEDIKAIEWRNSK